MDALDETWDRIRSYHFTDEVNMLGNLRDMTPKQILDLKIPEFETDRSLDLRIYSRFYDIPLLCTDGVAKSSDLDIPEHFNHCIVKRIFKHVEESYNSICDLEIELEDPITGFNYYFYNHDRTPYSLGGCTAHSEYREGEKTDTFVLFVWRYWNRLKQGEDADEELSVIRSLLDI